MTVICERGIAPLLNRKGLFAAPRDPLGYRRETSKLVEELPEWVAATSAFQQELVCV